MVLNYTREANPTPLGLLAKIYTVDPSRDAPEDPRTTDFRAEFAALFTTMSAVDLLDARQLTMQRSIGAAEVRIDGNGADQVSPLRISERRAVLGHEQLVVTAVGSIAAFQELQADIDRWFESVAFVPLGEASDG